jgi:hypothetical protein
VAAAGGVALSVRRRRSRHLFGGIDVRGLVKQLGQATKGIGKTSKELGKEMERIGDDAERVGKTLS